MKIRKFYPLLIWASLLQPSLLLAQFQQTSGPEGGVINAMINHSGTLLAGSEGSGIFRSPDNGNTWLMSNTGLQSLIVFTFAEKDSVIFTGTSLGLYKSTDDGLSWNSDGLSVGVVSIAICGIYKFAGTAYYGIYRSDLNGNNWSLKNSGLTNLDITSITCSDSIIYVGTESGIFMSAVWGNNWTAAGFNTHVTTLAVSQTMIFAGTNGGGIYKSPVGSTNWTYSGYGMAWGESVLALKENDGIIYAGCASGNVYRSDDIGNTWSLHNNGLSDQYIKSLEFLDTVPLAGTNGGGIFLFDEAGDSWLPKNSGIINTSVMALLTQGSEIYCGTFASGIFTTSIDGDTWIPRSFGLPSAPVSTLFLSGQNLFCGLQNGHGIYQSVDQGQTWAHSGLTKNIYALSELPGKLLAGSNDGVYSSTDNGISWEACNSGLPSNSRVLSLLPVGTDVFAGLYNNGVYISIDQGNTWIAQNNGISGQTVYALAKNDSSLFAGTYGGIYRSMDNGAQWTSINEGLSSLWINSLINTPNGILAATSNGLFLSQNNGNYWTNVSDGFLDTDINSISVSGNTVFAGTAHNGVWSNLLSVISGSKESVTPKGFLVCPNPAHDCITVQSSDPGLQFDLIRIYDPLGNLVYSAVPGKVIHHDMDISDLPRGLYIIAVRITGIDQQLKLLVE